MKRQTLPSAHAAPAAEAQRLEELITIHRMQHTDGYYVDQAMWHDTAEVRRNLPPQARQPVA